MTDYLADMAYQGAEDSAHRASERLQDAALACHDVGWEELASYLLNEAGVAFRACAYRLDADLAHYSPQAAYERFINERTSA